MSHQPLSRNPLTSCQPARRNVANSSAVEISALAPIMSDAAPVQTIASRPYAHSPLAAAAPITAGPAGDPTRAANGHATNASPAGSTTIRYQVRRISHQTASNA